MIIFLFIFLALIYLYCKYRLLEQCVRSEKERGVSMRDSAGGKRERKKEREERERERERERKKEREREREN
jgi:hypothetical protein